MSCNKARWAICIRCARVEQKGIVQTMANWTQHLSPATYKTILLSLSHSNAAGNSRTQLNAFMNENPEEPRREVNQLSSVQFSHWVVSDSATPWTAAYQASLSITNSQSPPKHMSIESVMPSNNLILLHPRLLLPSIFPSTRVFSNELALHIRWPKYWSFSFCISPSNENPGLISFGMDW